MQSDVTPDDAQAIARGLEFAVNDLGALEDDDPRRLEAIRRLRYVLAARGTVAGARTRFEVEEAIGVVARSLGDVQPPHWSTLYRWRRRYESAGCDVRALVPATSDRGNRIPKASGRQLEHFGDAERERARVVAGLMDDVIRERYKSSTRPSVRAVHETLQVRIASENRARDPSDQLPVPHVTSVARRVRALDPYDTVVARHGRRVADEKFRSSERGPRPARPLERVECDYTRLDLMVVDPATRLPLGRPWLTTLLDGYSKLVLGIYLAFHHPGYVSVMQVLRHAIRPKDRLAETFPTLEHEWPAWGVPDLLVVDNAKEFYSRHFEDTCLQLGIEIDYAPPYCGSYKGSVERWFGTQNRKLLHELPGTTFSNIFDRGDYCPEKNAVISLDALVELVHSWIVDVYHQQVHRGIGDLPHRRWARGIAESPPRLPARVDELDVLVGCVEMRRITRTGIELFCLRYNTPELASIRRLFQKGEKAKIKYDPTNISAVHVLDPSRGSFVRAPALDEEYTDGLSLWQHEIIKRYARRELAEHIDHDALVRARARIEQIVAEERVLQKSLRGRQAVARYVNLGQAPAPGPRRRGSANAAEALEPPPLPSAPVNTRPGSEPLRVEAGWSASYDLPLPGDESQ